jgi:RNA polymerase sigma-70 factor (ECF subfamily)
MCNEPFVDEAVAERFLQTPSDETFAALFRLFTPQLIAFFRARGSAATAEDLSQEVMLTVYQKAGQVRDRSLFRAWLFTVARNALFRHYTKQTREVQTVDLAGVPDRFVAANAQAGLPASEFHDWMAFLDSREREALTLRFIEELEYHEIAAAQSIPIGTVQWRVFNAKKKLAPMLQRTEVPVLRKAA